MTKPWPPPHIKPFERLQVNDGTLMNAQRWKLAHDYHRQRQNVHYQSLNQPGIVCDLGVWVIEPPAEAPAKYRDERWVQIQPGIAIDLFGNLIVVTEPMDFRISSEVTTDKALLVYLVVSYVDPDNLHRQNNGEIARETFRIEEKTSPPKDLEVEVCRIMLTPGEVRLSVSADVFFPSYNQLDLRYRTQARSRHQALISLGIVQNNLPQQAQITTNLSYLLQSVASLYPAMSGAGEIGQVRLPASGIQEILNYDLLYFTNQQSLSLTDSELSVLQEYLEAGGVILVEAALTGTRDQELTLIQRELQEAIARLESTTNVQDLAVDELQSLKQELKAELESTETQLEAKINENCLVFYNFAQRLGTPVVDLKQLNRNHPLRTQPFLFAALPTIQGQPIKLLIGGGIVIVVGNLSTAWGLDEELSLPRETIRTAQEMGINILHFAWRRRQLTQYSKDIFTKYSTELSSATELTTPLESPLSPQQKRNRKKPSDLLNL